MLRQSLITICINIASRVNVSRACCIGCYTHKKWNGYTREKACEWLWAFHEAVYFVFLFPTALERSIKAATIYSWICLKIKSLWAGLCHTNCGPWTTEQEASNNTRMGNSNSCSSLVTTLRYQNYTAFRPKLISLPGTP